MQQDGFPRLILTEGSRRDQQPQRKGFPISRDRAAALPFPARAGVSCVASTPAFGYLEGREVHFSPDVETQLQQVALANGKDAEQLVKDTVARMLENQNRFIAGVQRGIEQADRGEFVEHKDVVNRIDRLFRLVSQPYLVVYRSTEEIIEILHIWHGAQDWR
jgi:predicted transcriptional regulator